MGLVNSALSALPEQKMFDKLRKLSQGALGTVGEQPGKKTWQFHENILRSFFLGTLGREGNPTNIGIARGTLSVETLVVVNDGRGRHLGCYKVFISLIYYLYTSISTPGQVLE